MARLFSWFLSIFLLLLLVKIAPSLVLEIKDQYLNLWEPKTKIGHIVIRNEINELDHYQKNLELFFKNSGIKAILIEIESSGGSVGFCQALYHEILQLKQEYKKPVIALSCTRCVSYAYYVACAADCIICLPSTLIGGIGLGKVPGHDNPAIAASFYQYFMSDVAARRGLSMADSLDWAEAKLFTGIQALKLHLVDELGSFYNALQKIKQLALIERDVELVEPSEKSLREVFVDAIYAIKNSVYQSASSASA